MGTLARAAAIAALAAPFLAGSARADDLFRRRLNVSRQFEATSTTAQKLELYTKAIDSYSPDPADLPWLLGQYTRRAELYQKLGRPREAAADYGRIIAQRAGWEIAPNSTATYGDILPLTCYGWAFCAQAEAYREAGMYDEMSRAYDADLEFLKKAREQGQISAGEEDSDAAQVYGLRANALLETGRLAAEIADWGRAIAAFKKSGAMEGRYSLTAYGSGTWDYLHRRGQALAVAGRIDEAVADLNAAADLILKRGPYSGDDRRLADCGLILLMTGRWDEAAARFAQAAHLCPQCVPERYLVLAALAEAKGGRREDALRDFDLAARAPDQRARAERLKTRFLEEGAGLRFAPSEIRLPARPDYHEVVLNPEAGGKWTRERPRDIEEPSTAAAEPARAAPPSFSLDPPAGWTACPAADRMLCRQGPDRRMFTVLARDEPLNGKDLSIEVARWTSDGEPREYEGDGVAGRYRVRSPEGALFSGYRGLLICGGFGYEFEARLPAGEPIAPLLDAFRCAR